MNRIILTLLALTVLSIQAADKPLKPNILIIFTDDQGYADLACYGNKKNKTPRLDQLAKEGTRFTSFYSQTVCGPSRSALLTGRQPIRSGGWGMPADEITWAELIREAGYQTACIGKWDVSNRKAIIPRMPNAQGFDYYFGALGANDNGTVKFHENNKAAGTTKDMGSLTRLYTDKAIDFLEKKRDKKKPFILYVAHTMMHTIIDASPKFRGKSKGGLYGDVVEEFDYETGRLLDTLDELKLSKDTLVIYTSDNGPWNQDKYTKRKKGHPTGSIFWGEAGPLRNGKGSPYEAGYRLPCIVRWPGKVPLGRVNDAIFATIDFMPTFANLCGFEAPKDRRIDGIDQTDLLLGKRETGREFFYFNKAGVRKGKWKYLKPDAHFHGYAVDDSRKKVDELYDLEADLGERTNLAAKHPKIVDQLKQLMNEIEPKNSGKKNASKISAPKFQLDYKKKGQRDGLRQIKATLGKESVVFDVTDQFGVGGGAINLVEGQWPKIVFIRLHLTGLEGFGVTVGGKTFLGSYHGENFPLGKNRLQTRMLDAKGNPLKGRYLLKSPGPNSQKRIVGYYEAQVPQSALKSGAKKIDLSWVDFYRR
jgi:arylsulfatase A-like enzyme